MENLTSMGSFTDSFSDAMLMVNRRDSIEALSKSDDGITIREAEKTVMEAEESMREKVPDGTPDLLEDMMVMKLHLHIQERLSSGGD